VKVLQLRQNLWENLKAHPYSITYLYLFMWHKLGTKHKSDNHTKGSAGSKKESSEFLDS